MPVEHQTSSKSCCHGADIASVQVATDPVCGMKVQPRNAIGPVEYQGQEYFFCSRGSEDPFHTNPAAFLGPPQPPPARRPTPSGATYTCPMHPEIRQDRPGSCPKCGMALEPEVPPAAGTRTEYTCPMHPQIVSDRPGNCPICGMALEPRTITVETHDDSELRMMWRRFLVSAALTTPLVIIAMGHLILGNPIERVLGHGLRRWIELLLATPVVLWAGWTFFVRAWQSLVNRSLNMFTLIALGVGTAYAYSVVATLLPGVFPAGLKDQPGTVGVYFEAAAVIVTLVLLGPVL